MKSVLSLIVSRVYVVPKGAPAVRHTKAAGSNHSTAIAISRLDASTIPPVTVLEGKLKLVKGLDNAPKDGKLVKQKNGYHVASLELAVNKRIVEQPQPEGVERSHIAFDFEFFKDDEGKKKARLNVA